MEEDESDRRLFPSPLPYPCKFASPLFLSPLLPHLFAPAPTKWFNGALLAGTLRDLTFFPSRRRLSFLFPSFPGCCLPSSHFCRAEDTSEKKLPPFSRSLRKTSPALSLPPLDPPRRALVESTVCPYKTEYERGVTLSPRAALTSLATAAIASSLPLSLPP